MRFYGNYFYVIGLVTLSLMPALYNYESPSENYLLHPSENEQKQ